MEGFNLKYILFIAVFLFIQSILLYSLYNGEKNKRIALEIEKSSIIEEREKYNEAQVRASNTIQKIQEKIKYVKNPCDCYHLPIPADVLDWVRGKSFR